MGTKYVSKVTSLRPEAGLPEVWQERKSKNIQARHKNLAWRQLKTWLQRHVHPKHTHTHLSVPQLQTVSCLHCHCRLLSRCPASSVARCPPHCTHARSRHGEEECVRERETDREWERERERESTLSQAVFTLSILVPDGIRLYHVIWLFIETFF